MPQSNLICIGVILNAHGILGEVKIKTFTQLPQNFFKFDPLYVGVNQVIKYTKGRLFKDDIIIAKFVHINTRNDSESLKGQKIYITPDQLSSIPLNPDEILYQDLVELTIIDQHAVSIGSVIGVHNYGAGDLLEIKLFEKGQEIFIPFNHPDVKEISYDDKTLLINNELIDVFKMTSEKIK